MPRTRGQTERPREPLLQVGTGPAFFLCSIGGRPRSAGASRRGAIGEIPPWNDPDPHRSVARAGTVLIGQFDWGGLLPKSNGGVQRYPRPGRQSGNMSANVEGCLTARPMGRADAKAGLSDPAVLDGKAVAQQIKGTPGITGLSPLSVHSGGEVWHLDVGSSHPGAGEGPKGLAVRQ